MAARVVVSKGRTGKFRVALQTAQGRIVMSSDQFEDKRSAAGVVRSLKSLLPTGTVFEDTSTNADSKSAADGRR
jgi:uncharacterized protein YegP (UPF0339 family)